MSVRKTHDEPQLTREVTVTNKLGLHARPASLFVKAASRYDCEVFVEKNGQRVNGKSIMGLLMLAAGPGDRLTIQVRGKDASRLLGELEELLRHKFYED